MKRIQTAFLLMAVATTAAVASEPVASVTSSTAFDLHGNRINVNGVPSWPVMAGDDITTQSGQAMIQLRDGSRVQLQGNSHVQVESKDDGSLLVRLLSGAMQIVFLGSSPTRTQFYTQATVITPASGQVVSVGAAPVTDAPSGLKALAARPAPISSR
jgi:hypothetical protein